MRTVIIGGGIGGLALASGLRRRGCEVVVLERDVDLAATGGYHITLRHSVQQALADLLPAAVFERLLASAADGRLRDPDVWWDRRGRLLGTIDLKGNDPGIDVDRVTLRLLLAQAVGDSVRTGVEFVGYERTDDGRVVAHLADGGHEVADLLVGADGTHSVVAPALAGGPTNHPTGLVGICGRTAVADLSERERTRLGTRSSMGMGAGGVGLYAGYLDPIGHAVLDAPQLRSSVTTRASFIWGAIVCEADPAAPPAGLRGAALRDATLAVFGAHRWDDAVLELITRTDPDSVGRFRFHAAPRQAQRQAPWPAGIVTALGDAVHATPPTAGMGAGAAVLDAHRLWTELGGVATGERSLLTAVRDYEADLRVRGAAVVDAAMQTVDRILSTRTPIGAATTAAALPVLAGVAAVRGRFRS